MKQINMNKTLFTIMIVSLLCVSLYLKFTFDHLAIVDWVMMIAMAGLAVITIYKTMFFSLLTAFGLTLLYGCMVILSGTTDFIEPIGINYYYLILPAIVAVVLGFFSMINKGYLRTSKNFTDQYNELVRIDSLTGFRNRQDYDDNLIEEIERARRYEHPLSLLMIHIESFDDLNHLYGLSQGEKFLKHFSEFIIEITRQSDKHYRIGHNLFALILPNTDYGGTALLKERFIQDFETMNIVVKSSQQKVSIEIDIVFEAYRDNMSAEAFHQVVLDELVVKPRGDYEENI